MAPKKEDHDLGRVKSHAEGWRVVVKLAGTKHYGPRRNVRSCADDDLVAMRAVPRTEMAAHLAQLKTIAAQARFDAAADAASVPSAPIHSSPAKAKRPQKAEPAFPPAAERTIADNVGGGVDAGAKAGPIASPSSKSVRRWLNTPPSKRARYLKDRPAPLQPSSSDANACMMQTLTLRGICIQYPFSRLILELTGPLSCFGLSGSQTTRAKDIEVRKFPMAPAPGSHDFCHPSEEMFLIETPPQGPADIDGVSLPPAPKRAQVIGTVTFDECSEYTSLDAFKEDAKRHRVLPNSKHDWDGKSKCFAWTVEDASYFVTPLPAVGHNMYGFQKPKTLEVQYCVFSDVLRHTEGVDEPVSPLAVQDMVRERLAVILLSWPAPEDVLTPALGDASEVIFAELYVLWGLDAAWWEVRDLLAGEYSWARAERATDRGRAGAEALRKRLLSEYWGHSDDARREIMRETSALLAASAARDGTALLDDVASKGIAETSRELKGIAETSRELLRAFEGFHKLHVVYSDPQRQRLHMCLVTRGSAMCRSGLGCRPSLESLRERQEGSDEDEARHATHCTPRDSEDERWWGDKDAPERTNASIIEQLASHTNPPRICDCLRPGGFAFVTEAWLARTY